jgi:hypothetical protein
MTGDWDYSRTWYHGSPLELAAIREGSTITQDRRLAEVFSHKPTIVSVSDDGRVQHNGTLPGFLYYVVEEVGPEDAYPHPRTTMEEKKEWLTRRELRVALIGPTRISDDDRLSEEDIVEIRKRMAGA